METILIVNSGSSTLKLSIYSLKLKKLYSAVVDKINIKPQIEISFFDKKSEFLLKKEKIKKFPKNKAKDFYSSSLLFLLDFFKKKGLIFVAAGHRIVHGKDKYIKPVLLNKNVIKELKKFIILAPLHQPYNLKGVEVLNKVYPHLLQVGCFDTAFHSTCNPISQMYALAKKFTDAGIRKYGFHGLSYEYLSYVLPKLEKKTFLKRVIIAHLGNGASMCALKNLKSEATSIGFSAVDGLVMGTRAGALDPMVIVYLMANYGYSVKRMQNFLHRECGLLGVSQISSDMRDLLKSKKKEAKIAIDLFVHRICLYTGQLMAEIGGVDTFVFTAGIGEKCAEIRKMVCKKLKWLGVEIDDAKNKIKSSSSIKISTSKSKVNVWKLITNEEYQIAKHTLSFL